MNPTAKTGGFTLVELMVVVGILAILISTLIAVSVSVLTSAKIRDTRTVLLNLQTAIDQFNDEAPLKRVQDYRTRYGNYPCDELEGFAAGIPGSGGTYIGPGGDSRLNATVNFTDIYNQDIKAMALVMRLYSAEVATILDRISPRYRRPPDNPEEFFDRNGDGTMGTDDVPLGYFVDTWGTPLQYFAIRDDGLASASDDPMKRRLKTSSFLVQRNRGKSVLVSYGPNGPDQWSEEAILVNGQTDLVTDYHDATPGVIDNLMNEDNVYVDEALNERLRQGNPVD